MRNVLWSLALFGVVIVTALYGLSKRSQQPHPVPVNSKVESPSDGWLLHGVLSLSRAVRQPIGIELLPTQEARRCGSAEKGSATPGLGFAAALDDLVRCAGRYRILSNQIGIVEVRPLLQFIPNGSFLDQAIDFDVQGVGVRAALERLHQTLNPKHGSQFQETNSKAPEDLKRRRATINLRGRPVREVLNSLCASFGASSWTVEYPGGVPVYSASRISISSVSTPVWVVAVNARPTGVQPSPR